MPSYTSRYPDLVKVLIYQHCHSDAPENRFKIQKRLTDGLDFDEAGELIEEANQELSFIHVEAGSVWYEQNEAMLLYIRDRTNMDIQLLSSKFHHLKPPSLRDKYNL